MSLAQSKEKNLRDEERARDFEALLNEEIKYVECLMKPMEKEMKMESLPSMTEKKVHETSMELARKVGLLLLKFNSLEEKQKINLFDKLMNYVQKFKNLLEEYGTKLGVESFSIDVGFPWGVSISLTFKPR
jgi:hypothetical protein